MVIFLLRPSWLVLLRPSWLVTSNPIAPVAAGSSIARLILLSIGPIIGLNLSLRFTLSLCISLSLTLRLSISVARQQLKRRSDALLRD